MKSVLLLALIPLMLLVGLFAIHKAAQAAPVTAQGVLKSFGYPPNALHMVRNDNETLDEMRTRLANINQDAKNITLAAQAASRDLTDDERADLDKLMNAFDALDADIERLEGVEAMQNRSAGRRTDPNGGAERTQAQIDAGAPPARPETQPRAGTRPSVPAVPRDERLTGRHGFNHAGEFFAAVVTAGRGGKTDPRLYQNAPTTYGNEGVGADGGFAVPPDFRTEIVRKVLGEDSLLSRTDQQTTSSNGITFPTDETTPWQQSGGIQAYWESEGGQKQQSKPSLGETTVKANKVIALVPMTDELLQDAPAMARYVNSKAPEKIEWKVSDAIINGTGVGQPLGIMNSPGTIVVPKASGQAADTVVFQNIVDMWARMYSASKRNAVWLMNSDAEAVLPYMKFIDQGSGNAVPVYLPPGGLSASPYASLYGRPVITSESMPALGDEGDIVLADMKQYLTLVKAGGIRQDVSIHLFFDYDITTFRFVMRVGGQPWWNKPIERPNGGASRGFFIKLGARA